MILLKKILPDLVSFSQKYQQKCLSIPKIFAKFNAKTTLNQRQLCKSISTSILMNLIKMVIM